MAQQAPCTRPRATGHVAVLLQGFWRELGRGGGGGAVPLPKPHGQARPSEAGG